MQSLAHQRRAHAMGQLSAPCCHRIARLSVHWMDPRGRRVCASDKSSGGQHQAPLPGQQPDVVNTTFGFVDAPVGSPPGYTSAPPSLRSLQRHSVPQSSQKQAKQATGRPTNGSSKGTDGAPNQAGVSLGGNGNGSNGDGSHGHATVDDPAAQETVAAALARAQEALDKVESSLESIEELPSAQLPSKWAPVLGALRTAALVACCSAALVGSHAFGLWLQLAAAAVGAVGIAWWGYSRASLSASGATAALFVGAGTLGCSLRFGATLLAFFFSSSKLTHFKEDVKAALDDSAKAGGQRNWVQVLSNGAVPTAIAIAYGIILGCLDVPMGLYSLNVEAWRAKAATLLAGAFLGYYACCCGDTWASELGPLSADTPRLITTMRPVRKGTNGGVTLLGLQASMLGGLFVGLVFYAAAIVSPTLCVLQGQQAVAVSQWRLVPLGLVAGLFGSLLDSVLGATVQFTGYNRASGKVTSKRGPDVTPISGIPLLDNNMVNMVSATLTAGLTGLAALAMFG